MNLMEWDTTGGRHVTLTGGVLRVSAPEPWKPTTKMLLRGGRFTSSGLLLEVASRCGATVIKRHRGFSNYDELAFLEQIGLLETGKLSGPRGGKLWSLTERGAAVLAHLQRIMESTHGHRPGRPPATADQPPPGVGFAPVLAGDGTTNERTESKGSHRDP